MILIEFPVIYGMQPRWRQSFFPGGKTRIQTVNENLMADDKTEPMAALNREIQSCQNCRLHETRLHAVCGEGSLNAALFLVGQAPGETEDNDGRMFIGRAGKLLDELLENAGIRRGSVYMSNLVKCRLPGNREPRTDEIAACSPYLQHEIALVAPRVIAPLGTHAARRLLRQYGQPLPSNQAFSSLFGRLVYTRGQRLLPLPHPAALLYQPASKSRVSAQYRKLHVLLNTCRWYSLCPMKRYFEAGRLDGSWIALYCKGDWQSCIRYQMEERGEYHPDWMLPDGSIDDSLRR